ncbi:DUF3871 family protein [Hymenobacter humi]|uniref:DUF3871 family protein n=1 Tax=Hymenobacter humi TaxID=1411620 RepID=A0ABW2U819_9BACT
MACSVISVSAASNSSARGYCNCCAPTTTTGTCASLQALTNYSLTEHQFAQLIGRCRMYQHLPAPTKQHIPALLYGDQQLASVCKDYYRDQSFCCDENGDLNLWRLYNLFTGANKSTYIDQFLDRSVNALDFAVQVQDALEGRSVSLVPELTTTQLGVPFEPREWPYSKGSFPAEYR